LSDAHGAADFHRVSRGLSEGSRRDAWCSAEMFEKISSPLVRQI
jgi:hypothetical protein